MIPLVYSLEDCKDIMKPSDIPCRIKNAWNYPKDCDQYSIDIYNETPILLETRTMGSNLVGCNITFNYTKLGTYFLNFSTEDTAIIKVEADEMAYVSIGILLAIVTLTFFIAAIKVKQTFLQIALSLITLLMLVTDFFMMGRFIQINDPVQTNLANSFFSFYNISLIIFRFALMAAGIFLLWYLWKYILTDPYRKRKMREERFYD
jgi:hypothetical protein